VEMYGARLELSITLVSLLFSHLVFCVSEASSGVKLAVASSRLMRLWAVIPWALRPVLSEVSEQVKHLPALRGSDNPGARDRKR